MKIYACMFGDYPLKLNTGYWQMEWMEWNDIPFFAVPTMGAFREYCRLQDTMQVVSFFAPKNQQPDTFSNVSRPIQTCFSLLYTDFSKYAKKTANLPDAAPIEVPKARKEQSHMRLFIGSIINTQSSLEVNDHTYTIKQQERSAIFARGPRYCCTQRAVSASI